MGFYLVGLEEGVVVYGREYQWLRWGMDKRDVVDKRVNQSERMTVYFDERSFRVGTRSGPGVSVLSEGAWEREARCTRVMMGASG